MPKRYPFLRMISAFYKLLSVLVFLTTTGAVLYSAANAIKDAPADSDAFQTTLDALGQGIPIAAVGLVLMITFYAFAEILDLLVSLNLNVRVLAKGIVAINKDRDIDLPPLLQKLLED
jgi:hypothetical protein